MKATTSDVKAVAQSCFYNGTMCLLKVLRVVAQPTNPGTRELVLNIHLDGRLRLSATPLHAFSVIRDGQRQWLPTNRLLPEDLMWVDVSAFCADGSFHRPH